MTVDGFAQESFASTNSAHSSMLRIVLVTRGHELENTTHPFRSRNDGLTAELRVKMSLAGHKDRPTGRENETTSISRATTGTWHTWADRDRIWAAALTDNGLEILQDLDKMRINDDMPVLILARNCDWTRARSRQEHGDGRFRVMAQVEPRVTTPCGAVTQSGVPAPHET